MGMIADHVQNALAPIIRLCQSPDARAMKGSLEELAAALQEQATALTNQAGAIVVQTKKAAAL